MVISTLIATGDVTASSSATIGSTPSSIIVSCPGCTSGSGSPAGTYVYSGKYGGNNYYQLGTSWYIWWSGNPFWKMSPALGSASPEWFDSSPTVLPPYTSSWGSANGASGTLTTTSGSQGVNTVVISNGVLSTTGAGSSMIAGNLAVGTTTAPSTTLQVGGASSTIRIGSSALPGCLEMGNSDGSGGINYITVLNGVMTATTTKPANCQ